VKFKDYYQLDETPVPQPGMGPKLIAQTVQALIQQGNIQDAQKTLDLANKASAAWKQQQALKGIKPSVEIGNNISRLQKASSALRVAKDTTTATRAAAAAVKALYGLEAAAGNVLAPLAAGAAALTAIPTLPGHGSENRARAMGQSKAQPTRMGTGEKPYTPWTDPVPEPKVEPVKPASPGDVKPPETGEDKPRIPLDPGQGHMPDEIKKSFPWWAVLALGGSAFAVGLYRDYKRKKEKEGEEAAQEELQATIQKAEEEKAAYNDLPYKRVPSYDVAELGEGLSFKEWSTYSHK
jgi:hypothetical protein